MDLSIVSTMYYSAPYLREYYERCCAAAGQLTADFEIVLVNDGSPDESLEIAVSLHECDARVRVVDLSRNFGHHNAIMEGLAWAAGKRIFLLDCDLEEPPEVLPEFWNELDGNPEIDMVCGVQAARKGGFFERVSGRLFWRFFRMVSGIDMPDNTVTARLMSRRYVDALLMHRENQLFLGGLSEYVGFGKKHIPIKKGSTSGTTYTPARKLRLFANAITSFSAFPLVLIFYIGTAVSFCSMAIAAYFVVKKLIYTDTIKLGWTSVMVSVWFVGGVLMMFMGILGVYLSKIFLEVKRRPRTIVRAVYGKDA